MSGFTFVGGPFAGFHEIPYPGTIVPYDGGYYQLAYPGSSVYFWKGE